MLENRAKKAENLKKFQPTAILKENEKENVDDLYLNSIKAKLAILND